MSTSPPPTAPAHKATSSGLGCVVTALIAGIVAAGVSLIVSLAVVLIIVPTVRGAANVLEDENGFVIEEGLVDVPLRGESRKGEMQVYYRRPFLSPPKLSFPNGMATCYVVEQTPESFTIGRDVSHLTSWMTIDQVSWKAEGIPR